MEREAHNKTEQRAQYSMVSYFYHDDSDSPSIFSNLCQCYTSLFLFLNIDIVKSVTYNE